MTSKRGEDFAIAPFSRVRLPVSTNELKACISTQGKQYTGAYTIQSGVVTVTSMYGSKSTQLGSSPSERVAGWLLGELVVSYLAEQEKERKERERGH